MYTIALVEVMANHLMYSYTVTANYLWWHIGRTHTDILWVFYMVLHIM